MPTFEAASPNQRVFLRYGIASIPDPRDADVEAYLAEELARRSPVSTRSVSDEGGQVLTAFAERAATRAVRSTDVALLDLAVRALAFAGLAERESIMVLALVEDAANKLDVFVEDVFGRVAEQVGPPAALALVNWLSRQPEDRTLTAMGYTESSDDTGFLYRWAPR
ncbi:hypothetical protein [Actinokineospora diospyrosa]|uniref:Uncharacterized protein n=1 Tax=Actinokineospora diospyrosa TaxID=103728 RepID=A0ABT1ICC5_9PSEU|nr:hypothetical protein [Actinokineospora diospyrosa]MCP2270281.1 hypothetical protein [Actinokineospora diospyrosa]